MFSVIHIAIFKHVIFVNSNDNIALGMDIERWSHKTGKEMLITTK